MLYIPQLVPGKQVKHINVYMLHEQKLATLSSCVFKASDPLSRVALANFVISHIDSSLLVVKKCMKVLLPVGWW